MCNRKASRWSQGLAILVAVGFTLTAASTAKAVQASGACSLLPSDNNLSVNEQIDIIVRVTNTSTDTGGDGTGNVPAVLTGTTVEINACQSSSCAVELPGTLGFVSCTVIDPGVASCTVDGGNPNRVNIVMSGGGVSLPAGGFKDLVSIKKQAINPILSPANGQFYARAQTGPDDLTACSSVNGAVCATGGAEGSTTLFFPGVCGDGIFQPELGEQCDDGNDVPYDGCGIPGNNCAICVDSEPCVGVPDQTPGDCTTPGCEAGYCVQDHISVPDSTVCTSVTDIPGDCATPGCEAGVCVATHIPEQDSTPCTDTDGDMCTTAGCEAGQCVQTHVEKNCDDGVFCNGVESCEPSTGNCVAVSACPPIFMECADIVCNEETDSCDTVPKPDSTPCTDTDQDPCTEAGCEAGQCVQTHVQLPCNEEICRTPGFWATHAGEEKKGSTNITQVVINYVGCMEICGEKIDSTALDSADSAVEAMCVSVQGQSTRQLARQLTAAALNCIMTAGTADCAGVSIGETFAACNAACANGEVVAVVGTDPVDCIEAIDAFNNGLTSVCHEQPLCNEALGLCFQPPGPAGSPKKCRDARQNDCTVIQPNEANCGAGDKSVTPETCP